MKRGDRKSFSIAEGGGGHSFWVVLTQQLEVLAILIEGGGGAETFHSLKGGGARKVLPCLDWGTQHVSAPRFFHFVDPPPRN